MFIVVGPASIDLLQNGIAAWPSLQRDEPETQHQVLCDAPLRTLLGGSGGSGAFVLARLGMQVLLCSAIGRDAFGEAIGNWLAEAGVRLAGLVRSSTASTSSTIILADGDERQVRIHYPGATAQFDAVKIPPGAYREGGVLLLSGYPQLAGWTPDRVAAAFAEAHQAGVRTALDLGTATGEPASIDEIAGFLPDVAHVLCSHDELKASTGESEADAGAERLLVAGTACVVVRDGSEATVYARTESEPLHVSAAVLDEAETDGPAEAFHAGFLYAVQRDWPLDRAGRFGHAVAALVARAGRGALGAPTLTEVERLLQRATAPPTHS